MIQTLEREIFCVSCQTYVPQESDRSWMDTAPIRVAENVEVGEAVSDEEEEEAEWVPPTEEQQRAIQEKIKAQEKVSSAMGALMLKRWTMMAETCSVCFTPLMRNPANMDLFCCSCDKIVSSNRASEPATSLVVPVTQSVKLATPTNEVSTSHTSAVKTFSNPVVSNVIATPFSMRIAPVDSLSDLATTTTYKSDSIVTQSRQLLYSKLSLCNSKLASCDDLHGIKEIAECMKSLMEAAKCL